MDLSEKKTKINKPYNKIDTPKTGHKEEKNKNKAKCCLDKTRDETSQ